MVKVGDRVKVKVMGVDGERKRIGLSISNELGSWRRGGRAVATPLSEGGTTASPAAWRPRLSTGGSEGSSTSASVPSRAITLIPRSVNCVISSPIWDSLSATAARSRMIGRPAKNAGEVRLRLSSVVSQSVIGAVGESTNAMSERPWRRMAPCGRTAIAVVTTGPRGFCRLAGPISALRS